MSINKVGVVGAGQMGAGIAQVAAQAGAQALVTDLDESRLEVGRASVRHSLGRLVKKQKLTVEQMGEVEGRIRWSVNLSDHGDRDIIVEAIPEIESLKKTVLAEVETCVAEHCVIASNTSSISITRLGAALRRPEMFIGMHFMNPVPMMKLVEVIRGAATKDATCTAVEAFADRLGKTTTVAQDYPGFLSNRILMPLINEAFFALMEGVGSPEDIDTTLTLGMGHPMGPLALADLIGLDTCLLIMDVLHSELGDPKYRPCPLLKRYVAANWFGRKSGKGVFEYGTE